MRFVPHLRRLQFRLSTWFVLVAILVWAMIEWPWIINYPERFQVSFNQPQPTHFLDGPHRMMGVNIYTIERASLNSALKWPAVALTAFVAWTAAGALWWHAVGLKAERT